MKRTFMTMALSAALVLAFVPSCKKEDIKPGGQDKPIVDPGDDPEEPEAGKAAILSFSPAEGPAGTELKIVGKNLGSSVDDIVVIINGRRVDATDLQDLENEQQQVSCKVPRGTTDGVDVEAEVKLSIKRDGKRENVTAKSKFKILIKSVVETLCGYGSLQNGTIECKVQDGSFGKTINDAGFGENMQDLFFDPVNPNIIWCLEAWGNLRKIDLNAQYVSTVAKSSLFSGEDNFYSMAWMDQNTLLLGVYQDKSEDNTGILKCTRDGDSFVTEPLLNDKLVRAVAVHPINKEVYYLQDQNAGNNVKRFDPETKETETLFQYEGVPQQGQEDWNSYTGVKMVFHPTGKYAYIIHAKSCLIERVEYDEVNKTLQPTFEKVVGNGSGEWVDGIGTSAQLFRPYQGVFVKNQRYVEEGLEDQYDFYLCDSWSGSIRKITPDYVVSTFAGRGSEQLGGNLGVGDQDGHPRLEARFTHIQGITYDEATETFYVADAYYRKIRKIHYID